jgi:hypothetical protein
MNAATIISLIAAAGVVLTIVKWAFLPDWRLPRNRVRHLRIRLRLRLHPGRGHATLIELWWRLGAGGVPGCAVRDVQALAVGAAQRVRDARPLRRGESDCLAGHGLTGEIREERGGVGRGHGADVRGEALAEVADQVRLGPGRLGLLNSGDGLGEEPV